MSEFPYAPPPHLEYLLHYADFGDEEVTVEKAGACPNCGSDQIEYAGLEDHDPHAGEVILCHNCGEWCYEDDLDAQDPDTDDDDEDLNEDKDDDDWDESEEASRFEGEGGNSVPDNDSFKRSKTAAGAAFSMQGAVVSQTRPVASGIAIRPDAQSEDEMRQMISGLQPRKELEKQYVQDKYKEVGLGDRPYKHDNPFVNRGGKTADSIPKTTPTYPEEFVDESFIIVAEVTSPDYIEFMVHPSCHGIITGVGGSNSHGAVVAREAGLPCIVDCGPQVLNIQPGDHIEMIAVAQDNKTRGAGVVNVNGGDPSFTAGPDKVAASIELIFINVGDYFDFKDLRGVPHEQRNQTENTHTGLAEKFMATHPEQADSWWTNGVCGIIYDNGNLDIIPSMSGEANVEANAQYAQSISPYPLNPPNVTGQMPAALAKTAEEKDYKKTIKCPSCSSHSFRTIQLKDDDKSDFNCLTCGTDFKHKVIRVGTTRLAALDKGQRVEFTRPERKGQRGTILKENGTDENFDDCLYDVLLDSGEELEKVPDSAFKKIKSASMQKGAPYPENSYKNSPDHSPPGQHLPKQVNAIYNACMRDNPDYGKEKCMKIAWSQHEKSEKKGAEVPPTGTIPGTQQVAEETCPNCGMKMAPGATQCSCGYKQASLADTPVAEGIRDPWLGSGYEGHPVMCYMCGNTRTAALGTQCEHCGYILSVRRDGPVATQKWAKTAAGEELEPGKWYTMKSKDYDVPDVIKVLEIDEDGITTSIEGDDKGLFPLHINSEEAVQNSYTFEPYELPALEGKTARRSFSVSEQKDLINENPQGRARNYSKLDLDGTHYDLDALESESSFTGDDVLSKAFLW